ncbi:MAG: flagellin [Deltaproteobacteria bacterium]|jgi:flagellin|nr:flagellin [Deltaproteobacteria bacterium]
MAIGINSNIMSLNAQRQLGRSGNDLATSMARLSSGLRINSAKDDAAGLAISDRMTSQIRGLNQASRNANDAISLAQTAEGALQESTKLLHRMRDLSVQSANDSNSATDRANLQKEVTQIKAELDRIATSTQFNGKRLLDGTFTAQSFHIGAFANENLSISLGNARSNNIGANELNTSGDNAQAATAAAALPAANSVAAGEDLTVSGSLGSATIDVAVGASARAVALQVNGATAGTGVTATAVTRARIENVSAGGTIAFSLSGSGTAAVQATVASAGDLSELADSINGVASTTGVTAQLSTDRASIELVSSEGYDIGVANSGAGSGGDAIDIDVQGLDQDGVAAGAAVTLASGGNDSTRVGGTLTFSSPTNFTVTSAAAGALFAATTANASALNAVSAVNIGTQAGANNSIAVIDAAIQFIDDQRGDLGAVQNRLEATIANLDNVAENVTAARARVVDADFAAETAKLTRNQILQQAGVAMLAQANQAPQVALSLLQR